MYGRVRACTGLWGRRPFEETHGVFAVLLRSPPFSPTTHSAMVVRHLRVVRRNLVQELVRDLGEVAARTTVLCQGQLAPRDEAVNDRHGGERMLEREDSRVASR